MAKLPPVPHQSQMSNERGLLTNIWADWFRQAFARMGGSTSSTNDELSALILALETRLVPVGVPLAFTGSVAPSGYLLCNGNAVSRTTFAPLFAVMGVSHGSGDGSTTFNLPDYRGRFLRGFDSGVGRDLNAASRTAMALGGSSGDSIGSIQTQSTKLPNTAFTTDSQGGHSSHWTGTVAAVQAGTGINALTAPAGPSTLGAHTHTVIGGDLETRPINASVNWIVKT